MVKKQHEEKNIISDINLKNIDKSESYNNIYKNKTNNRRMNIFIPARIYEKVNKILEKQKIEKNNTKQIITIYQKSITIFPKMIKACYALLVHNGKRKVLVKLRDDMLWTPVGIYVLTRTFKAHGGSKSERGSLKK